MFGRRYVFYFCFARNLRSTICSENVRKPINKKKIGQCVYDVEFFIKYDSQAGIHIHYFIYSGMITFKPAGYKQNKMLYNS